MEVFYFTAVAIVLYVAADWILDRIERWQGQRLPYRSVIFFAILASMALISFSLLQHFSTP